MGICIKHGSYSTFCRSCDLDTINHSSTQTIMNQPFLTPAPEEAREIKRPIHIQLATIRRPMGEFQGLTLSKAVSLEYMGNAHFEFGALPRSMRRLQASFTDVKIRKVDSITSKNGSVLRVLSTMSDEQWQIYEKHLHDLREDKIHTEEVTRFAKNYVSQFSSVDFWWDIDNDTMWSFDKQFMNRLTEHLSASFKYMDEQKKATNG